MATRRVLPSDDYREFVFRATGRTRNLENVSPLQLRDNLLVELDRLRALSRLMGGCREDLRAGIVQGLAEVLRDIDDQMRAVLGAADRARGG